MEKAAPITFRPDMVRAILEGRKTVTRRPNWKPGPGVKALTVEGCPGLVLEITDVRREATPRNTLEISHGPLDRKDEVYLPQNWAWQIRQVQTFRPASGDG